MGNINKIISVILFFLILTSLNIEPISGLNNQYSDSYDPKLKVKIGDRVEYKYSYLYYAYSDDFNVSLRLSNETIVPYNLNLQDKIVLEVYEINKTIPKGFRGFNSSYMDISSIYVSLELGEIELRGYTYTEIEVFDRVISVSPIFFGLYRNQYLIPAFDNLSNLKSFLKNWKSQASGVIRGVTMDINNKNLLKITYNYSQKNWRVNNTGYKFSVDKFNWKTGWLNERISIFYDHNGTILSKSRINRINYISFFDITVEEKAFNSFLFELSFFGVVVVGFSSGILIARKLKRI